MEFIQFRNCDMYFLPVNSYYLSNVCNCCLWALHFGLLSVFSLPTKHLSKCWLSGQRLLCTSTSSSSLLSNKCDISARRCSWAHTLFILFKTNTFSHWGSRLKNRICAIIHFSVCFLLTPQDDHFSSLRVYARAAPSSPQRSHVWQMLTRL